MHFLKGFALWCCLSLCLFGRCWMQALERAKDSKKNCSPFSKHSLFPELQKTCGYNATVKFKDEQHFAMAARAVISLTKHVTQGCSSVVNTIVCSVYLPRCEEDIAGPFLPCRRVCDVVHNDCKDKIVAFELQWIIAMCQLLPRKDYPNSHSYLKRCFEPPGFKSSINPDDEPKELECHDLIIPGCKGLGYSKTVLPDRKQRSYISRVEKSLALIVNESEECKDLATKIYCTEHFPACIDKKLAFFCRKPCYEFFKKNCTSLLTYGASMCMEFPDGDSDTQICKQEHWPRFENWKYLPTAIPPTKSPVTGGKSKESKDGSKTKEPKNTEPHRPPGTYGGGKKEENVHIHGSTLAGAIIGSIMAGVCITILVIGIAWCIYKRKKKRFVPYDQHILYHQEDNADM